MLTAIREVQIPLLAAMLLGACLAIGAASDQILAGDLAPIAPQWSAVAPESISRLASTSA